MKKKEISKKQILLLMFSVLFVIILLNNVSAQACWIEANEATCNTNGGYKVMGLSAMTNAHGELASQTNYALVLCCDFGTGDTTCEIDNSNKILGLSAETNAHAEIPSQTTYQYPVCYESLSYCLDSTSACASEEIEVITLSASTNAHLGTEYPLRICCAVPLQQACSLTNAFWSLDGVTPLTTEDPAALNGQNVYLVVGGTNCNTKSVSFEVIEGGTISQGSATTQPSNVIFSGSKAVGTWTTEFMSTLLDPSPEFYFTAEIAESVPLENIDSIEPMLVVDSEPAENYCFDKGISSCKDYDETYCNSDRCDVADYSGEYCDQFVCSCTWDSEASVCKGSYSAPVACGDGIISTGEQCEVDGDITLTCESFGFTGGPLSCVDCMIETSLCTGGTKGICVDGTVNIEEQCEQDSDLTDFSCTNFDDFTGEGLFCNSNCMIDTSECVGGEGDGTCMITQNVLNECEEEPVGLFTYSWGGEWLGSPVGEAYALCTSGENTIECPAQVQLPFFDIYGIIIAVVLVTLIYLVLTLKKKKK